MSNVQTSALSNGLRVVTAEMPFFASVSVGVWVGTGARAEEAAINGAAHYLEHMAFKGTTSRTARDIALEVENVGGYFNAYTARENTAYFLKVLKDNLPLAVDILSDILQNPIFDPEELERERGVIQQEIGQSLDTPDDIIYDYFQETAYPDQAMGRPILGTSHTVQQMSRDNLINFMDARYRPRNMVLVAAGAVSHAELLKLAEDHFGNQQDAATPIIENINYQGGDFRDDKESEQVHFKLGFNGVAYGSEDQFPATILSTLLGGGSSSRLFEEIREKRGLVYSVYSYSESFIDGGLFGIYAGTGAQEISELIPVLCDSLNDCRHSINADELERAKTQLKATILMGMESCDARANQLGTQLLTYNRFWTMEELSRKIEAVSIEEVQQVAAKIFSTTPTLAAIGPLSNLESYDQIRGRL
ncbi:M16 family metallopeptidase [Curvivirga aplysinae]|uniref:M16 family metallopeptidase n=1 Tax=Curvivirga aplysinae TaxID=2529852 RepID=UPI0012BCD564|nr:pitrilysin family protein [Curvivirga aplysinae]MTI09236.1 insulinase family protein [Curvivirga aplysinae]